METYATIKGQIVIPSSLRRKYGIKQGTKIQVYDEGGRIILEPITREYVRKVRGSFKGSGALRTLMVDRSREREL